MTKTERGTMPFTIRVPRRRFQLFIIHNFPSPSKYIKYSWHMNHRFTSVAMVTLLLANPLCLAVDGSSNPGFSIQQQGETAWMVKPAGERFFSLGVCCVNQGA